MSRPPIANRVDLNEMFRHAQDHMYADLERGDVFDHPIACGAAAEQGWIALLGRYLPERYRASSAFIVDADGRRSRQIDIAIYDHLYSPVIFPHESGVHVPAESVYAVFEVKQLLTRPLMLDAGRKAASVRALRRTSAPVVSGGTVRRPIRPAPILAGILAMRSIWEASLPAKVSALVRESPAEARLDLGCALQHGAFECNRRRSGSLTFRFSAPKESLIFFLLRLLERLHQVGTAPALDLMEYGRCLDSFRK